MNLYRLEDNSGTHQSGLISADTMMQVLNVLDKEKLKASVVKRFEVTGCDVTVVQNGLLEADKAWSVLVNDTTAQSRL